MRHGVPLQFNHCSFFMIVSKKMVLMIERFRDEFEHGKSSRCNSSDWDLRVTDTKGKEVVISNQSKRNHEWPCMVVGLDCLEVSTLVSRSTHGQWSFHWLTLGKSGQVGSPWVGLSHNTSTVPTMWHSSRNWYIAALCCLDGEIDDPYREVQAWITSWETK